MDDSSVNECFFEPCGKSTKPLITVGSDRIRSIINASQVREDGLAVNLERRLDSDSGITIMCHKDCVSSYTSKHHLERLNKNTLNPCDESPSSKRRRSELTLFNFKEHCLFCGEICRMEIDPKHPGRCKRAVLCQTADRGNEKSFKQSIIDACNARQDDTALQVQMRILSAVSDLHAADARYHDVCRKSFMSVRSVTAASRSMANEYIDRALDSTIIVMKEDMSRIWNSSEVYDIYKKYGVCHCLVEKLSLNYLR